MSGSSIRPLAAGRRASGFTVVELVITVAIVAILAALALPNFREFSVRMTVTDNTNDLVGALNVARSEAVKRGRAAAVIANDGDWNSGWQVVVAKTTAGGIEQIPTSPGAGADDCADYVDNEVDADNEVPLCPRYRGALADTYTITAAATGGALDSQVTFSPTGAMIGADRFDFSVCRPSELADPEQSRHVLVEASGIIVSHRGVASSPAGTCS